MIDCEASSGDAYFKLLTLYGKQNCTPVKASFEITPLCNFNCPMCYVHMARNSETESRMLTADNWINIAEQAKKMGVLNLTLTGGEIFTYSEFWKLYSELNKMGFLITLLSNGYLIDDGVKENFRKYGMPHFVKMSMYGASNETYEKMCGVKNGFDRFLNAVEIMKELKIPYKITSTVVSDNIGDLDDMYRIAREKNFPFSHTFAVTSSSRNHNEHTKDIRFFVTDFVDKLNLDVVKSFKHPVSDRLFDGCSNYRCGFWISWDGKMKNCSFSDDPSVSALDNSLEQAWKKLNEEIEKIEGPEECKECEVKEFCLTCPGVMNSETGSYNKVSTAHCEEAKRLFEIYNTLKKESD